MGEDFPLVMRIDEAAKYLRVPLSSLYKLAQEGRIPCQKVGRQRRFRREALDRWLEQTKTAFSFDSNNINHNKIS